MDGSDVRYLAPSALDRTRFDMAQGEVSLTGRTLAFRGLGGSRCLSIGRGWVFDLTAGVGGAEQLQLCGDSANYHVSMQADVLTLAYPAEGTVVRLQAGRGPHLIVFDDGWVRAGDLWRNVTQTAALTRLAGAVGAADAACVTSHVHPSSHAAFIVGAQTLPEGAVLRVSSLDKVETLYGPEAASRVCLDGVFADYGVTMQGDVVCLSRLHRGRLEGIHLIGASQVNFADGELSAEALRHALRPSGGLPILPLDEERPRATTVALAIEPMTASCSESWFVGLSHGGMLSGLCVGQVIEATVTFDMAVFVSDAPQVRLRVGGLRRLARYSGCSSSDTLRFTYVVTEDDVLEISMNARQAGITAPDRLRLDIEVGDLLCDSRQIRPLSGVMLDAADAADGWSPEPRGDGGHASAQWQWREQAGFRVKVDVNLDELEALACA